MIGDTLTFIDLLKRVGIYLPNHKPRDYDGSILPVKLFIAIKTEKGYVNSIVEDIELMTHDQENRLASLTFKGTEMIYKPVEYDEKELQEIEDIVGGY